MATLASIEQLPLIDEVFASKTSVITLGGSALNSARGLQHWYKVNGGAGKVMYIGGIGKDEIGATMKEKTKAAGVDGNFYECEGAQTGCCACVVTG